jgi:hypothetical protein
MESQLMELLLKKTGANHEKVDIMLAKLDANQERRQPIGRPTRKKWRPI